MKNNMRGGAYTITVPVIAVTLLFGVLAPISADAGAEACGDAWKKVEEEKYGDALALFEEAANSSPSNGTYRRFVGWVLYSKLGRNEDALPHLRRAKEMIPNDTGVHLDFAVAAGNLKLYDEALVSYENAIGLYEEQGEAAPEWVFTGCASIALFKLTPPDIGLGKHYLDRASKLNHSPEVTGKIHSWISLAYQNAGWAAVNEKKLERALRIFEEAYAFDTDNGGNIHGYGWVLREIGELTTSKDILSRGRALFPQHTGIRDTYIYALQAIAWEYDGEGDMAGALETYRQAFEIDRENQWSLNGYGALLSKAGKYPEAIEILEKGYRLYPDNEYIPGNLVNALRQYGDRLWKSGNETSADALFGRALEIQPDNFWLRLAMYYSHRFAGRNDTRTIAGEVIRLIDEDLISNQSEPVRTFYIDYGNFLFSRREVESAREIINQGLHRFPDDPFLHSALAYTYFRIDMDKWRELSEQTISMIPTADQAALGSYQFPLKGRIKVSQGTHGGISHLGLINGYAWDFVIVNEKGEFCTSWERKENHFVFGSAVYAAADGVVEYVRDTDPDTEPGKNDPEYDGNFINIRHRNGEISIYAHIKGESSFVKVGDQVRQGQQIAVVGCSGRYVDFPHLHFQINRDNRSVEARLTGIERFVEGIWTDPGAYVPQQDEILKANW